MTRPVKVILLVIGALSILAGLYGAISNDDFSQAYYGIFIGVVIIGSVLFFKQKQEPGKNK